MANITVTHTFSNGTTADGTQVNTNFTDIINGTSDGTKDFSINALTVAGALTANGAVTLGNATGDDITITGSIAADIPIKTTFVVDVGSSTIGLSSLYFGSDDSAAKTVRVIAGTVGTSYTLTLPTSGGTNRYVLETNGSGVTTWVELRKSSRDLRNVGLANSVAASALTVALKGADGNNPSSTNPVEITFRNATAATGTPVTRTVTAALSVVVSSGSTLGHTSGANHYIYVYAIDNAGTVELAVSSSRIDEGSVQSTTAEGGAGGADSPATLYSTTARTDVAIRLLGRLKSNQTTAGTWAATATEQSLGPFMDEPVSMSTKGSPSGTLNSAANIVVYGNAADHDTRMGYSTSTGKYTVREAGKYIVQGSFRLSFTSGASYIVTHIYKNSTVFASNIVYFPAGITNMSNQTMAVIDAAVGDTFEVRSETGATSPAFDDGAPAQNRFAVAKIGE